MAEEVFKYTYRFGTQSNDLKAQEQNKRFNTMSASAKLQAELGGAKAFTPKDLELFQASEAQQRSCFRGYDKITINKPAHGKLEPWKIRPEIMAKMHRGF